MFDIDNILGNKKTKKSKSKDILLKLFQGQGNPRPNDYKPRLQKRFLKQSRNFKKDRFKDTDKDGVVDALDCFRMNPKKHMPYMRNVPTSQAYEMRSKAWANEDMNRVPRPSTRTYFKDRFEKGEAVEPIEVGEDDYKKGILRDGKHRILGARDAGAKEIPIKVYEDDD